MEKKFTMEYEKGGTIRAYLLEKAAPATCEKFWSQLPMETIVFHTRWSGRQISAIPQWNDKPVMENQTLYIGKGDIVYWREWEGNYNQTGLEVLVTGYGAERLEDMRGESRANHFARVEWSDWPLLVEIGLRIWKSGEEKVKIKAI